MHTDYRDTIRAKLKNVFFLHPIRYCRLHANGSYKLTRAHTHTLTESTQIHCTLARILIQRSHVVHIIFDWNNVCCCCQCIAIAKSTNERTRVEWRECGEQHTWLLFKWSLASVCIRFISLSKKYSICINHSEPDSICWTPCAASGGPVSKLGARFIAKAIFTPI